MDHFSGVRSLSAPEGSSGQTSRIAALCSLLHRTFQVKTLPPAGPSMPRIFGTRWRCICTTLSGGAIVKGQKKKKVCHQIAQATANKSRADRVCSAPRGMTHVRGEVLITIGTGRYSAPREAKALLT